MRHTFRLQIISIDNFNDFEMFIDTLKISSFNVAILVHLYLHIIF